MAGAGGDAAAGAADPDVQGGEQSMAGHLLRIDQGDRSHVGLPVFPLRNFTARDLYVRKGGGDRDAAADLWASGSACMAGRTAASVWYRHFLTLSRRRYPAELQWWVGDIDAPRATSAVASLPEGVRQAPAGRSLSTC